MFPQALRLRTNKEILSTYRKGERIRRGNITLFFLPSPDTKVTVIVDTKLSKRAVVRNLLKRQIRAVLEVTDLPQGHLVVRAYPGLEKILFPELKATILQCLNHPSIRSRKSSSPA